MADINGKYSNIARVNFINLKDNIPKAREEDDTDWHPLEKTLSNNEWHEAAARKNFRYPQDPASASVYGRKHGNDDAVWSAPRMLLSLDGGGIRGLSSLRILQELVKQIEDIEHKTWPPATTSGDSPLLDAKWVHQEVQQLKKDAAKDEFAHTRQKSPDDDSQFLLCHYFDYIAGTSTAGLIATMLGRMSMPIQRTQREFKDLTRTVYGLRHRSRLRRVKYLLIPHKSHEEGKVKTAVDEVFGGTAHFQSDMGRCKTIVCSFERGSSKSIKIPVLFRSYDENVRDDKLSLTDVMRATSCSPYYFSAVTLGNKKVYDAGLRWTNPTVEACREIRTRESLRQTFVLSIGCGYDRFAQSASMSSKRLHFETSKDRMFKTSVEVNQSLAMLSEDVHTQMEERKDDDMEYYRLNATFHLQEVDDGHISSWRAEVKYLQEKIDAATEGYLQQPETINKLRLVAERLVEIRRQRSRTASWEAFAFGVRYRCNLPDQCDEKNEYVDRAMFTEHICDRHRGQVSGDDFAIKKLVDRGRMLSDKLR